MAPRSRAVDKLRISNALLSVLGVSHRQLVELVSTAVQTAAGDEHLLERLLQSEAQLSGAQAVSLVSMLSEEDTEDLRVKRQKIESPPPSLPKKPAEENKVSSILDDPVVAAKAGLFEKLKDDPIYMEQLREEVTIGIDQL